ncbi:PREDICTED: cytochrome P450 306a1 [Nicrophorus vespilloides]|uniref:Cytochrome P450 306a1 n=1 Tax=Nicrophorus vespilloides TaxID=110193 RepID=A0ABM1MLF4_NICVS|nr:PREDICTED: cytochrome P450 306a1 [Nicrophorus vespilloides]
MGLMVIFMVVAIASAFWLWWQRRAATGMMALPPGPSGFPMFGYLPLLDAKAPHRTLAKLCVKYGKVFGLHLGNVYTVVLSDARQIRKVLAMDAASGRAPLYLTHGIMKGYGLICAEGALWKDQRRFVHSALKKFGMHKYSEKRKEIEALIRTEIDDCLKFIESDPLVSPEDVLRHNIGNVINSLVFGVRYERDDPIWLWLQSLQEEGVKHIGVGGVLNFVPSFRFIPKFRKIFNYLLEGKHKTHQVYREIIEKRKKSSKKLDGSNILEAFLLERSSTVGGKNEAFYTNQQFYHLLADVFGAGLDTTLVTISWFFMFMAANPEEQAKVHKEIVEFAEAYQHPIDLNDLPYLPLLEAALSETQRIRSVVPLGLPHGALRDIQLDDFIIPKGSMIVPFQWAIHMDPETYPDPETFRPDRFIDEQGKFFKGEAFIPFQTGNRMCIGEDLAKMLMLLFSVEILRRFEIIAQGSLDLEGVTGITLAPKRQLLLFKKRLE